MLAEQIHRYPRWITWLFELVSFLAVGLALARFARDLLVLLWMTLGIDTSVFSRVPYLPEIVRAISDGAPLNGRSYSWKLSGVSMETPPSRPRFVLRPMALTVLTTVGLPKL